MKHFHQNLLILLAAALCGLCAWQWYGQTRQRTGMESLNQLLYQKAVSIQGYTNSLKILEHQMGQMDRQISELKEQGRTDELLLVSRTRQVNQLEAAGAALTNEFSQATQTVALLEAKLKEAYDGIKKQNDAIKVLAGQRDEFVQKLNDSVKERNDIVAKYNELAAQLQKMQTNGGKP